MLVGLLFIDAPADTPVKLAIVEKFCFISISDFLKRIRLHQHGEN